MSNSVELQLPTYHADYSSSEIKMINLQNETLADHVVDNCRVKKMPSLLNDGAFITYRPIYI